MDRLAPFLSAVLAVALVVASAPRARAQDGLGSPILERERTARALVNLEILERTLERDRRGTDLEMALAVTLYVGGVMLAIASVSLLLGIALEAACVNGRVSECTDGSAFFAGAVPTGLVAATLLIGARLGHARVEARWDELDRRAHDIDRRRDDLERRLGLTFGPASIRLSVAF